MTYETLLENNRRWVDDTLARDPNYFRDLAAVHRPRFLWIGCSDARVPANVVTGTSAGEMFVHRNIANQVMPTDPNLLAVLQYAVEALGVRDVIVCGHQGCGGVQAALDGGAPPPHVDGWLGSLRMVVRLHEDELAAIADPVARARRLVELNVREQIHNLARTPVVQAAWAEGKELRLHGVVYRLEEGRLRDIGITMDGRSLAAVTSATAQGRAAASPAPRERVASVAPEGDRPW